jgi:hypothetical protein
MPLRSPVSLRKQLTNLLLYLTIALPLVVLVLLYAEYVPPDQRVEVRWVGLAGATAITFGYPLWWFRRALNHRRFWFLLLLCLTIHLVGYSILLKTMDTWPLVWFAVITPGEWYVICAVLQRAGIASFAP